MFSDAGVELAVDVPVAAIVSLDECIICGKRNDSTGCSKLHGTADGRKKISEDSDTLEDHLISSLSPHVIDNFLYHSKTCYANYRRLAKRFKKQHQEQQENRQNDEQSSISPERWEPT